MARKRWKTEEIVAILREGDRGVSTQELCRKHGMTDQTYYRWKKQYGGVEMKEVQRLKDLEKENKRLKQLAGDQALAIQLMKEELAKKGWG